MYIYFNTETNKAVSSERFDQIIEDFTKHKFFNNEQFHDDCIEEAVNSLYDFPYDLWKEITLNSSIVDDTILDTAWDIAKENATDLLFVNNGGVWIEAEVEDV